MRRVRFDNLKDQCGLYMHLKTRIVVVPRDSGQGLPR